MSDDELRFDGALEAILALESIWRSRAGRVRLIDLDLPPLQLVRSRGHAALPPERWRAYPGAGAFGRRRFDID